MSRDFQKSDLRRTLGILLVGIFPLRSEIDRLRAESVERTLKSSKTVQTMPPDQILAEELTAFHKRFPLVSELSDALDTLFSLAQDKDKRPIPEEETEVS